MPWNDNLIRWSRHFHWQMWVPAIGVLAGLPLYLFGLASGGWLAMLFLAAAFMLCTSFAGPIFATVQDLATPADRAVAAAIVVLAVGLIGGAAGPPIAGWLSDLLRPGFGEVGLGMGLAAILTVGHLAAGLFFWQASRSLRRDLAV